MDQEPIEKKPETVPAAMQEHQSIRWRGRDIHFDCTLDLGEAGSVSVPTELIRPYVAQAIRMMRADEVLRLTYGAGAIDSDIVKETMKSGLPDWCRSLDHVLLACVEPEGTICFYKRRRRSRARDDY